MNECNKKFLERNGIIIEDISSKINCTIRSSMDENPIIASYAFQKEAEREMISVADIVGYDSECRGINSKNIFLSLDNFFKEGGDGYHSRSLGLLEYNRDNIIEKLKESFINDPMSLIETGEGTYTILNNGLHRYTLLRALYLSEVADAHGNKEKIAELANKYTIPASVTGVDLDKTYCKYLLTKARCGDEEWDIADVRTEYDSEYRATDNVIIKYGNGRKEVLDTEQLLNLTKERVAEDKDFKKNYPELQYSYNKYLSFAMFIQEEFSDIIQLQEREQENKKGIEQND